jgi:hypothetical protein
MKRITPEEVVEAYRKTGLKPMPGAYHRESGHACGLGALAIADGADDCWISGWINTHPLLKGVYGGGFINGFDQKPEDLEHQDGWEDEYVLGYQDGDAARKAADKEFGVAP